MLVGLNLFSIICTRVLRSTPGKSVSTESIMPLALSPWPLIGIWVGYDVPGGLDSARGWSLWFAALSSANWVSNSAILMSVGFATTG